MNAPGGEQPAARRWRWRLYAFEALLFIAVLFAIQAWQARDVPAGAAPAFAATMSDGSRTSLAAWRAAHPGKVVGVYVWAEWCPICSVQQGSVDSLQRDWPVLTVAMQSGDPAAVATTLSKRGLAWDTVVDSDGQIAGGLGLHGVPALLVIGADGTISAVALGYTTELGMRLRLWWAQLRA